jgi:hypothetical protein
MTEIPPRAAWAILLVVIVLFVSAMFRATGPASKAPARSNVLSELSKQVEINMQLAKEHKVRIGMIDEQCEMAWGKPDHINRLANANGETEQWVYPNGDCLYFHEGVLKSIQTTR